MCAKKRQGVVLVPHPFRKAGHGIGYLQGLPVDAVETMNSKGLTHLSNKKAVHEALRLNLPQVGGSDAHIPELVGQCYTLVSSPKNTKEAILDAVLLGKTKPCGDLSPTTSVISEYKKLTYSKVKKIIKFVNLKK